MKTSHLILTAFRAAIDWAANYPSGERVASAENANSVVNGTTGNSQSFQSPSEFPMVFFAKENEIYHPLHNVLSYEDALVFAYGKSEPPTEITLENEFAKAATKSVSAGFKDEFFALSSGDAFDYAKIKVDDSGKVQNQTFFSCISEFSGYNHIINYNEDPHSCFKTDIYLGRYNPGTGQYIKVDFGAEGEGKNTQEGNHQTQMHESVVPTMAK